MRPALPVSRPDFSSVRFRLLLVAMFAIIPALLLILVADEVTSLELLIGLCLVAAAVLVAVWLGSDLARSNALLMQEIAERKQIVEALVESERRFHAIFDQTFQFIGLMKPDGTLLEANNTILQFAGLRREDVVNRPFWEARLWTVSPETQSLLKAATAEAAAGKFIRYEVDVRAADDSIATIDFSLTPIKDATGQVVMLIPEGRDVTERRKAEDALSRSEKMYRTLAQNLPQTAVYLFDRDLRYLIVEGTLLEMPGYSRRAVREMMEGKLIQDIVMPESQAWLIPYYQAALAGTGSVFERRMGERTILIQVLPVRNEDDEIFAGIAMMQDITERVRAEQALREAHDKLEMRVRERTADLKAANEELSTFTYIVSHDLRAPLINLKGFASELRASVSLIESNISSALPYLEPNRATEVLRAVQKDIPEALEFIDSSVARMDHLTNAVLRLSRLGRRVLNPEILDMETLVQTVINSLAHQIKQQQAVVRVGTLPRLVADRTAMEQIFGNLLSNAVLYLRPGCPGQIEVTGETGSDETTFHIKDNGRGIADEERNKVFEPFRRAGKPDTPGEGMGLAYVQTLVRRHGGRIWFTSQPGVGTTFSFTIPNDLAKERQ
jgi:PAS domain S-box-containing protein